MDYLYLQLVFSQTFNMAPGNRRRSAVSVIDTQIASSDLGSVAPGSVEFLILTCF